MWTTFNTFFVGSCSILPQSWVEIYHFYSILLKNNKEIMKTSSHQMNKITILTQLQVHTVYMKSNRLWFLIIGAAFWVVFPNSIWVWTVSSAVQTIAIQCPNVSGHNCPITEAIWHTHNGPVRQASNMAATQKPQHILGTKAGLDSQGGLGKAGVTSLETPNPKTRDQRYPTSMKTKKNSSGIYISPKVREWRSLSKAVRGF